MPKFKFVTVSYLYEGKIYPEDNERGVLLPDGKVLVGDSEVGIYAANPTDKEGVYLVDIDKNPTDYLRGNRMLLLDLIGE